MTSKYKIFPIYDNEKYDLVVNDYFVFIQIPKTSSTNVLKKCKDLDLTRKLSCYRHEGLEYLETIINIRVPVYAIVRNPYRQIHSWFFFKLRDGYLKINNNLDIVQNFEIFVKEQINNIHLNQCKYIKSNKNIQVKIFKYEENKFNNYLIKNHNIDLKLNETHYNTNELKYLCTTPIKEFFRNKDILNLIKNSKKEEFQKFQYSDDINDL
tara:strand:- start:643 stop:1272 length:630 start_codon:yes stop_codon:yes gene_type:complete